MKINPVNNTNFGALKNIRIEGKDFKKSPEVVKELLEMIRNNKDMSGFFDRWDTNIILNSRKVYLNQYQASIMFVYRELPTGNKIIDFFRRFKGSKLISQNKICWDFEGAVENLKTYLYQGGLISQIHYVNNEAEKKAAAKAAKLAAKQEKVAQKIAEVRQKTDAQSKLDNLIKDMTK